MHAVVLLAVVGALRRSLLAAVAQLQGGVDEQARGRLLVGGAQRLQSGARWARDLLAQQDVAGVDPGVDDVDADAGRIAVEQAPLGDVHPAVARQQPVVGVDRRDARDRQQRGGRDVRAGQQDEVGRARRHRRERIGVAEATAAVDRKPALRRPVGERLTRSGRRFRRDRRDLGRSPAAQRQVAVHDAEPLLAQPRARLVDERRAAVEDLDVDAGLEQRGRDLLLPGGGVDPRVAGHEHRLHRAASSSSS